MNRFAHNYIVGAMSGTAVIAVAVAAFVLLVSMQAVRDWPASGLGLHIGRDDGHSAPNGTATQATPRHSAALSGARDRCRGWRGRHGDRHHGGWAGQAASWRRDRGWWVRRQGSFCDVTRRLPLGPRRKSGLQLSFAPPPPRPKPVAARSPRQTGGLAKPSASPTDPRPRPRRPRRPRPPPRPSTAVQARSPASDADSAPSAPAPGAGKAKGKDKGRGAGAAVHGVRGRAARGPRTATRGPRGPTGSPARARPRGPCGPRGEWEGR